MPLFGKHRKDTTTHHGRQEAKYDAQRDADYNAGSTQPLGSRDHGAPTSGAYTSTTGPTSAGDPYGNQTNTSATGPGSGLSATGPNPAIPPVSHINTHSNANRSGSTGGRVAGKAERAVGTLVGSQALKEKGFQKEQEAGAFKMQSAEIAEAERLEKEALMRRERAVAHGAHPENRHLGGLQNANTLADVTGPGTGTTGGQYGSGGY
ncbi:hypothetical protein C8Q76DRAFT_725183 [Earliella scabrosa]|nr:hypothetical protein C8Q76DRAFT_725183 [Earliella scabrosa]